MLRQKFLEHVAQTSPSPLGLEIERAEGVFLYTPPSAGFPDGRRVYDLISGVSVSNVGHGNAAVVRAVQEQAARYMHAMVYGETIETPQVTYAARLAELLPDSLQSVYFVNSGAEAIEGALKLARRVAFERERGDCQDVTGGDSCAVSMDGGRRRCEVVAFRRAYHGSTSGAMSLMSLPEGEEWRRPFEPLLSDVKWLTFNNFDELNEITDRTICVVVEPVQGEAGVRLPAAGFLQALRKRCDETGALLIFDEIQTGMGRCGLGPSAALATPPSAIPAPILAPSSTATPESTAPGGTNVHTIAVGADGPTDSAGVRKTGLWAFECYGVVQDSQGDGDLSRTLFASEHHGVVVPDSRGDLRAGLNSLDGDSAGALSSSGREGVVPDIKGDGGDLAGTVSSSGCEGVVPDILCLAKAFGGGMPLGAFVASREMMSLLSHDPALGHITTFGGHPVCCAAGLAALGEILGGDLVSQVEAKGALYEQLVGAHPSVREVRRAGLLLAVELGVSVEGLMGLFLGRGVLSDWFLYCDTAFRISPPLTISEAEIRDSAAIILSCLDEFFGG